MSLFRKSSSKEAPKSAAPLGDLKKVPFAAPLRQGVAEFSGCLAVCASLGGNIIGATTSGSVVRIYESPGILRAECPIEIPKVIFGLFSHDTNKILLLSEETQLFYIWDHEKGTCNPLTTSDKFPLANAASAGYIETLASFSNDDSAVVILHPTSSSKPPAFELKKILVWDVATATLKETVNRSDKCVASTRNGMILEKSSNSLKRRDWSAPSKTISKLPLGALENTQSSYVSESGNLLATVTTEKGQADAPPVLGLWDLRLGQQVVSVLIDVDDSSRCVKGIRTLSIAPSDLQLALLAESTGALPEEVPPVFIILFQKQVRARLDCTFLLGDSKTIPENANFALDFSADGKFLTAQLGNRVMIFSTDVDERLPRLTVEESQTQISSDHLCVVVRPVSSSGETKPEWAALQFSVDGALDQPAERIVPLIPQQDGTYSCQLALAADCDTVAFRIAACNQSGSNCGHFCDWSCSGRFDDIKTLNATKVQTEVLPVDVASTIAGIELDPKRNQTRLSSKLVGNIWETPSLTSNGSKLVVSSRKTETNKGTLILVDTKAEEKPSVTQLASEGGCNVLLNADCTQITAVDNESVTTYTLGAGAPTSTKVSWTISDAFGSDASGSLFPTNLANIWALRSETQGQRIPIADVATKTKIGSVCWDAGISEIVHEVSGRVASLPVPAEPASGVLSESAAPSESPAPASEAINVASPAPVSHSVPAAWDHSELALQKIQLLGSASPAQFAVLSSANKVELHDISTGKAVKSLFVSEGPAVKVSGVSVSTGNSPSAVLIGTSNGKLTIHEVQQNGETKILRVLSLPRNATFQNALLSGPNHQHVVVSAVLNDSVQLLWYDLHAGRLVGSLARLHSSAQIIPAAFSADNTTVAWLDGTDIFVCSAEEVLKMNAPLFKIDEAVADAYSQEHAVLVIQKNYRGFSSRTKNPQPESHKRGGLRKQSGMSKPRACCGFWAGVSSLFS